MTVLQQPSHEWRQATHGAVDLLKHALETDQGKAMLKKAVGTAVAAATVSPILLPVLAIGAGVTAAIWWFKKC